MANSSEDRDATTTAATSGWYREVDVAGHPVVRQVWSRRATQRVGSPMFAVARTSPSIVAHLWDDRLEVEHRPAGLLTERPLSPRAVGFVLHPWIDPRHRGWLQRAIADARWSEGDAAGAARVVGSEPGGCDVDPVVASLATALERSPDRATQQRVAATLGWSARTVRRRFRAATGMSVDRYRVVARAARAREVLLAESVRLADAAAELGFADQSHLHRDFVDTCGYTPTEWRTRAPAWSISASS